MWGLEARRTSQARDGDAFRWSGSHGTYDQLMSTGPAVPIASTLATGSSR